MNNYYANCCIKLSHGGLEYLPYRYVKAYTLDEATNMIHHWFYTLYPNLSHENFFMSDVFVDITNDMPDISNQNETSWGNVNIDWVMDTF